MIVISSDGTSPNLNETLESLLLSILAYSIFFIVPVVDLKIISVKDSRINENAIENVKQTIV